MYRLCQRIKEFAKERDFIVNTSSPTYPQSNGLAEKTVQTVKLLYRKSKMNRHDPCSSLLDYRNTPLPDMQFSLAKLLMNTYQAAHLQCQIETSICEGQASIGPNEEAAEEDLQSSSTRSSDTEIWRCSAVESRAGHQTRCSSKILHHKP